ncbi:hypothetical protein PXJ20_10995 [Paraburkholderia sp. A1RI_3L]|jgi:hypothetical protein|uniref:hypothetical protein n=1 Tax=Paraburkholderia TaxID=1822464 RepID=UPI000348FFFF|nr:MULTISPECIES: hypothetical protein [Paraburkholderia]WEY39888.1 hypothetical protein P2869_05890 [Paraburkholderia sp. SUR17]
MNETTAIVVGSCALAMAAIFVAGHYRLEQWRRKKLGLGLIDVRRHWRHGRH